MLRTPKWPRRMVSDLGDPATIEPLRLTIPPPPTAWLPVYRWGIATLAVNIHMVVKPHFATRRRAMAHGDELIRLRRSG